MAVPALPTGFSCDTDVLVLCGNGDFRASRAALQQIPYFAAALAVGGSDVILWPADNGKTCTMLKVSLSVAAFAQIYDRVLLGVLEQPEDDPDADEYRCPEYTRTRFIGAPEAGAVEDGAFAGFVAANYDSASRIHDVYTFAAPCTFQIPYPSTVLDVVICNLVLHQDCHFIGRQSGPHKYTSAVAKGAIKVQPKKGAAWIIVAHH